MNADRQRGLVAFELGIAVPTLAVIVLGLAQHSGRPPASLLLWTLVVALVELLPVPVWRGVHVGVGFPMLIAVAFLYDPIYAAAAAFVASSDPRELKREVSVLRAAFNRSQIALSVLAASLVFHSLADIDGPAAVVLGVAVLAATADYIVNSVLVTIAASIHYGMKPVRVVRELKIGNPFEFFVSYLGLGVLGVVLAQLYLKVGFWSVAVFIVPLILARQMFFRSRALEEAHKELADREAVLRRLSNLMAEERQDERAQIAAYLHDDLAQLLFRLSLQVDLASRFLEEGDVEHVRRTLAEVKGTKDRTSEKIRSLIRDLDRSPLGRAGLAEALNSFTTDVGASSQVTFDLQVADLPLPPPIQLLTYQIAREAIINSLKYAEATKISVSFGEHNDGVELVIHDDGRGFDAEAGEPEGHYGLTIMKERAQVAGGTFDLVSARGHGTGITVRFPSSWLQQGGNGGSSGGGERKGSATPAADGDESADAGEEPHAVTDLSVIEPHPESATKA